MNNKQKFWIGVATKDHVEKGVNRGICQVCHGKANPLRRMSQGDFFIYYSSKYKMDEPAPYQKFTAIGLVNDQAPYQVEMENGFKPFRRSIEYKLEAKPLDIKPLIPILSFIENKKNWGYVFKYGFLEIDIESFLIIANGMLGYNLFSK